MQENVIESEIVSIDESAFEAAFGPGPDDLVGAQDKKEPAPNPAKQDSKKEDKKPAPVLDNKIEEVDLDELDEDDEDEKGKDDKKDKKPAAEEKKTEQKPPVEQGSDEPQDEAVALRNHAEYLIQQGIWQDIEDKENIEWTDEAFAQIAEQQAVAKAEAYFEEMVDETGVYGKAIFGHIRNGGDPNEIIDIFKEQKAFENIDVTTEDGQKKAIEQYYTTVLKWKPERVKKHIERLELDEELKEEADHVQAEHKAHSDQRAQATLKAQEQARAEREKQEQEFQQNMLSAVEGRKDLEPAARKALLNRVLVYNQQLPDGRRVNQFYVDFMKVQSDPEKYLRLVEFIADMDKFQVTASQKSVEKEKKATIKFLANSTANTKAKTQASARRQSDSPGLDW